VSCVKRFVTSGKWPYTTSLLVRYHHDRLTLYRARVYNSKPTQTRLRELERTSAAADERLRHASRPIDRVTYSCLRRCASP
jgi:maleate cis-trans isomerase